MSFPYRIDATGRTARPRDLDAEVRELVVQVLATVPGERVMRPQLGTGVRELSFAPANQQILSATSHLVRGALQQWLAEQIEVADVAVESRENTLVVDVRYRLRADPQPRQVSVELP